MSEQVDTLRIESHDIEDFHRQVDAAKAEGYECSGPMASTMLVNVQDPVQQMLDFMADKGVTYFQTMVRQK